MDRHDIDSEWFKRLSHVTIEQAVDGIFWLDAQGQICRANEAACRLFGYSCDELLGLTIADIDTGMSHEGYLDFWEQLKQEKKIRFESCHARNDGHLYPAAVTSFYIECGNMAYSCNFFRDITGLKRAEQALKESEERFRSTFEQAPVGVAHVTLDGKWLQVNQTLVEMTGYGGESYSNIAFKDITFKDITHPGDMAETQQKVDAMKAGQISRFALRKRLIRRDGSFLWCYVSASLKLDGQGKPEYMIAIIQDISAQKEAEDALHQAMCELTALKNRLQEENSYLQEEIRVEHNFGEIIGRSDRLKRVLEKVEQVAPTQATVLISGETGTGKELIARAVHDLSHRKDRPLVKVNCAALPANLIESELFGHEKGAFTGALVRKKGRFEMAHRGTIFLDEIGDLPLELQAKLLRVLQEGEFERLGNPETIQVDVRVIAATNRDLKTLMDRGMFREDLYYRLNVFPIEAPPLRERREDVAGLVKHFIQKYRAKSGSRVSVVAQKEMHALESYRWPGNVRELENIIERALILSRGEQLELEEWLTMESSATPSEEWISLEENERLHIQQALDATHGRVSGEKGAGKLLGINAKTLRSRMVRLGMIPGKRK
jgi:PAS domain S-box-containing protein